MNKTAYSKKMDTIKMRVQGGLLKAELRMQTNGRAGPFIRPFIRLSDGREVYCDSNDIQELTKKAQEEAEKIQMVKKEKFIMIERGYDWEYNDLDDEDGDDLRKQGDLAVRWSIVFKLTQADGHTLWTHANGTFFPSHSDTPTAETQTLLKWTEGREAKMAEMCKGLNAMNSKLRDLFSEAKVIKTVDSIKMGNLLSMPKAPNG